MVYIHNWFIKKNLWWEEKNWNQTELIITISKIDYCIWLATGAAELVQILFMPFCFEIPPVYLSVCPPLPSPPPSPIPMFYQVSIPIPCTVTMAIPGLWRHCCSSVLVSFFNFTLVFLSALFGWFMSGLSNSVSISKVVLIFLYFWYL